MFSRVVAGAAGVFFAAAGSAAFVAPAAFFEAAAAFEPYNTHLIRDIGAFQVGLGVVLLLAVWVGDGLVVALAGVGVGSLVHSVGHVLDRDLWGYTCGGCPLVRGSVGAAARGRLRALADLRPLEHLIRALDSWPAVRPPRSDRLRAPAGRHVPRRPGLGVAAGDVVAAARVAVVRVDAPGGSTLVAAALFP